MESFDSLLSKSIKKGKEFRFYAGAVLILSVAVSFLVFLACDKTFEELLQRENGMISIMYLILAGIFAAVFLYLLLCFTEIRAGKVFCLSMKSEAITGMTQKPYLLMQS